MDFLLAFSIFTVSLIICIIKNISIIIPLIIGLCSFSATAAVRGYDMKNISDMIFKGMKKSFVVIRIFVLIGSITAIWRACGTIPFFVYYGAKMIQADYFILFSFLLPCIVSFALGTSFGTVGTIGVVLIVLAKGGGVDVNIAAGAIISGAYFGDRCSPTSSSANLVATITETNLYDNVKNMFITAFAPFVLTVLIYIFLSKGNPLNAKNTELLDNIMEHFRLHWVVLIPALIIFALSILRLNVKLSMSLSIISGIILCMLVQKYKLSEIIRFMIWGFSIKADNQFGVIISGGGIMSMVKVAFIVLIASSYSGIFEETGMLNDIQKLLEKVSEKIKIYPTMILTSIVTTIFSCNQTLAIILTNQLMNKIYKNNGYSNSDIAIDLENTVVLIAELIPWSIAVAVPIATLSADVRSIPYAVFLYLVPVYNLLKKYYFTGRIK